MIWCFAAVAAPLIWTGFEASTNGHHALGYMLAICGLISLVTGAGLDIYINHLT